MEEEDRVRRRVLEVVLAWAPGPVQSSSPIARLVEDLGYDSLALMELAVVLEHEIVGWRMPEAGVADVETVDDVVELALAAMRP
jgi:acyl carrier protein